LAKALFFRSDDGDASGRRLLFFEAFIDQPSPLRGAFAPLVASLGVALEARAMPATAVAIKVEI